ncbi:MAG: 1-acyl-sn-glycerol-3-phosphate acyltransferase [Mucilaginibacter polytrichastri]|nr:1-acyl-sn-glycerol-3-phosphate acyltransferase [Mucilaginibacter polytrichastri]
MLLLLKKVHNALYRAFVGVLFAFFTPFLYSCAHTPEGFARMNRIRRVYAFITSALSGIFYRIRYAQKPDWNRPYIICANHSSNLDITAMLLAIRGNFRFMGKDELLDNFVTGFFFRSVDIPVNRESKISSFRAFKKAEESIQNGMSVLIFPEGLIAGDYPPVLQPFKNGAFRLAIQQQVPIIPVTITDTWKCMWDDGKRYGTRPGICHIFVHSAIETAGMPLDHADNLKDEVRDIIARKMTIYAT